MFSTTSPETCLSISCHVPHLSDDGVILWNWNPTPIKHVYIWVALAMVSPHSKRMLTIISVIISPSYSFSILPWSLTQLSILSPVFFTFSYHICTFEIGKAKEKGREGKERKGKGRAGKGMAGQSMAGQGGEGKGRMTRKWKSLFGIILMMLLL